MDRTIVVNGQKQFNHQVVYRDPKTGATIKEEHYVMNVSPSGTTYESPPGSGMVYNTRGELLKDGLLEKREAEAKKQAQEELEVLKAKEAERVALMAEVEKQKAEIIAAAKAEANAILSEADAIRSAVEPLKGKK